MNFKTGEPIPEDLRDAMNAVLEKRDYSIISVKDGMASESTIRDLLAGDRIKSHTGDEDKFSLSDGTHPGIF